MPTRRRSLAVALGAVAALVAGGLIWQGVAGAPAGTPQAVEFVDAPVSDALASATVLALGEATHGTSEFQRARLQLLQKTVDRGFTTIVLEDGAGPDSRVDAWLQGGPGTVDEAAAKFGYGLYRTREMAELLTWIRAHNAGRADAERVRLYGADVQHPDADKAVALQWLGTAAGDAAAADSLGERLAGLTDAAHFTPAANEAALPAARELQAAVERAASGRGNDATLRARLSARALVAGCEVGRAPGDVAIRDQKMAEQLAFLVEQRGAAGGRHTLLFAHNGHVDRVGEANAATHETLGKLSAERWGIGYRAIGTDFHLGGFRVSDGTDYQAFSLTVNSPVRGLFAGTRVGYIEVAAASGANREVLGRRMPMVSTGAPYAPWQGLVPMLHQVDVVPQRSWDALVYVTDAQPVTRLT